MRKENRFLFSVAMVMLGIGVLCAPVSFAYTGKTVFATATEATADPSDEETDETAQKSEQVASDDERTTQTAVGEEGAYAKYADDVNDGVYDVVVESSSSMFRIEKAVLTVENGKMHAVITLGGTGYLRLFMGTGLEAVEADPGTYAEFTEDADGAYSYAIDVEALDKSLECTGFSKRKEKWYDHQISFLSSSLPAGALKETISDGTYKCAVTLTGGTGKASVESPAVLTVRDNKVFAKITWSSPHYDYMLVGGRQYLPENKSGNSVFSIPVSALDEEMPVIADTTAMSEPHEIEYTLHFDTASMEKTSSGIRIAAIVFLAIVVIAAICVGASIYRKSRRKAQEEPAETEAEIEE